MKTESWRQVPNFDGYQVSSLGNVRSVDRVVAERGGRKRLHKSRPIKSRLVKGYPQVTLSVSGKPHFKYVHQLVCEAFNGARTGRDTRHLDGNPLNNTPENLAWGSPKENYADRVRHGTVAHTLGPRNWDRLAAEIMRYGEPLPCDDDF